MSESRNDPFFKGVAIQTTSFFFAFVNASRQNGNSPRPERMSNVSDLFFVRSFFTADAMMRSTAERMTSRRDVRRPFIRKLVAECGDDLRLFLSATDTSALSRSVLGTSGFFYRFPLAETVTERRQRSYVALYIAPFAAVRHRAGLFAGRDHVHRPNGRIIMTEGGKDRFLFVAALGTNFDNVTVFFTSSDLFGNDRIRMRGRIDRTLFDSLFLTANQTYPIRPFG